MMEKIRITEECSDEDLAKQIRQKVGKACSIPSWTSFYEKEVTPPDKTVAIVVDMRKDDPGLVYIYSKRYKFKDMVGKDALGQMVVIPWEKELKFVCYGSCRVGEVHARELAELVEASQST